MYIRKPGSKTWHKLILWRPAGSDVFSFKSCNCGGYRTVEAFLNQEAEIRIRPRKDTRCKVCEFAPVSYDGPADLKRRKLWDRIEIGVGAIASVADRVLVDELNDMLEAAKHQHGRKMRKINGE